MRIRTLGLTVTPSFAALVLTVMAAAPPPALAQTQFAPYYGKNAIRYDHFRWQTYQTDHFEIYFYDEIEPHLERMAGYAESAYQHISSELKHDLASKVPLILFQTSAEFYQQNVIPGAAQEGVGAFAEPSRYRILMPMDEPPDLLYRLMVHELTHIFQFDIIPTSLIRGSTPLWVNEGMSDYMTGVWKPLDIMMVRDAAIADVIPPMSQLQGYGNLGNLRGIYNLGHAAFEFMEAKWGKEGVRQFVFALRKSIIGGGDDAYMEAFQLSAEEWDIEFDRYLKERFKPFRDKERPADYGRNLAPSPDKTRYAQAYSIEPSPSGDLMAVMTGNSGDRELDIVLISTKDGQVIRNLTPGFDQSRGFEYIIQPGGRWISVPWMSWSPTGDRLAYFVRTEKDRSLVVEDVLSRTHRAAGRIDHGRCAGVARLLARRHARWPSRRMQGGVTDIFVLDLESRSITNITKDSLADYAPTWTPDGRALIVADPRQRQREAVPRRGRRRQAHPAHLRHPRRGRRPVPRRPHPGLLLHRRRPQRGGRSRGGQERRHLQRLDARHQDRRARPLHRRGRRQPRAGRAQGRQRRRAAHRLRQLLQGRLRRAHPRSRRSDRQGDHRGLRRARPDRRLPGAAHPPMVDANVKRKGRFEKLYLEGRPPVNVGLTSGGDFLGGTAIAFTDVLGDQQFTFFAASVSQYRSFSGSYLNLERRFQYALQGFMQTQFFYGQYQNVFYDPAVHRHRRPRPGRQATQTSRGGTAFAIWPFNRYRRLELSGGVVNFEERFEDPGLEDYSQEYQEQQFGRQLLNNGTMAPIGLAFVQETTLFREFGPLAGNTVRLSYEVAPRHRQLPVAADGGPRRAQVLPPRRIGPARVPGARLQELGRQPRLPTTSAATPRCAATSTSQFVGQNAAHLNAELRIPLIHAMATPIGILGGIRGTLFANVGGAYWNEPAVQRLDSNDTVDRAADHRLHDRSDNRPAPASRSTAIRSWSDGFRLVDARASYGIGLQTFALGFPIHFDWSWRTMLQRGLGRRHLRAGGRQRRRSAGSKFTVWIGYDF